MRPRSRGGAVSGGRYRCGIGSLRSAAALTLLLAGCAEGPEIGGEADTAATTAPPGAEVSGTGSLQLPLDSAVTTAPLGEDGWQYGRSSEVDVDGDGERERVVVAARAEVRGGQPLWDDGQPWQVYVEEESGERTVLYARYVQLGTLIARVTFAEENEVATVLILEHLPDAMTIYEIEYRGPGQVVMTERTERRLDPVGDLASPSLP